MLPRTSTTSQSCSPQDDPYSAILTSSENFSQQRLWSNGSPASLKSRSDWRGCFPGSCDADSLSASVLGHKYSSGRDITFSIPQDWVRKLSPNDDGLKMEGEGTWEDEADGASSAWEEELMANVFHECDTEHTGSVEVDTIIAYLRRTASQDAEDGGLEELRAWLDPENTNPRVDLGTFQDVMKEWTAHCRNRREMSDLMACVTDLRSNKQDLEEENTTCKLALEATREANRQLAEDCTSLSLQMQNARQAASRGSQLQEELEDLRITMAASEERWAMTEAQNKQLKSEIKALLLKIRALQEENIQSIVDIDSLEKKIKEFSETEQEYQMQLYTQENMLLTQDARLQEKDLCIEELESAIMDYQSAVENLRGDKNKLVQELQHLQHKLLANETQVHDKGMASEGQNSLYHELTLAWTAEGFFDAESSHYDPLSCAKRHQLLQGKLKPPGSKPQRWQSRSGSQIPLTWKHCGPLLDALYLEGLTALPRLQVSCVRDSAHTLCDRPPGQDTGAGPLGVTRGPQKPLFSTARCSLPTGGAILGPELPECTRMMEDLSVEENGVGHGYSESLSQLREYLAQPSADHTSSSESPVTSSDSGSDISHMPSGDPDCKSLCEKEEAGPAPAVPGTTSPAPEDAARRATVSTDMAASHLEAREETKTVGDGGKDSATGGAEASTAAKASVRLANFQQSENTSANEKEVEAEFLRLSLGLKCDWFTLEKRVKLEERSRDLAEENLKKEITNCLKLLESLTPLCEEDNQAQEIIKKLEKSIMFLSQCTTRVASRAEMLGAINQESRVSKAVEVMIQHVENLKRMYAKEHAELEELRQALLHNERSFNSLEDEDDCQIKKRSSSLNSKPSSLRRVTIASLPRNLGKVAMVSGMENSDRFSRRPSSWRILGTEQSEHRPSLHRFISTYAWADAEDEKRDKTRDTLEQAGEEAVERARKPSLSDRRSSLVTWDISTVCGSMASWVARLQESFPRFNRVLWLSVVFTVLCAALVSFLTSQLFQTAVEAAPTQEGDAWMSLEQVLWPLTGLRHNGPPPV